jgi:hypothetical protein
MMKTSKSCKCTLNNKIHILADTYAVFHGFIYWVEAKNVAKEYTKMAKK